MRVVPVALASRIYRGLWRALPPSAQFPLDGVEAALRGKADLIRHLDLTAGLLRRRRHKEALFVGWVLAGDERSGAARVRALLPHAFLRTQGVNSVIVRKPRKEFAPFRPRREDVARIVRAGFDVVVFQGVDGPDAEALARALSAAGTRTVYAIGDLTRTGIAEAVDLVVVASEALRAAAPGRPEAIEVIESAIDAPPGLVKDYARPPDRADIRVAWVGYPENLHLLEPVREALRHPRLARFQLVTISRGPGVTYQWDRKRVHQQLLACDIAVLPSAPTDWYAAKPNTRATMLKALGLPIVASPIASYLETLEHGKSGYFARDVEEWIRYLEALADFEHRRDIGLADRERILARYGADAIGRRWLDLLERLAPRRDR